ncbi:hypothetical protein HPB48_007851 [Haemaphysalis longicornis]|uniref:Reverse transcriptase domain-containing protein n=1 Tax=Haemaphysalis longicornis TaxID=44386 RepID=A0A9J6GJD7_HAELO|nr:hypothetical protein HPB48_007851 [Haemaphysalis longicornis]
MFRHAKKSHSHNDLLAAKQLQREVKKQVRIAHQCFDEDIASRAVKEPKLFWAYINSQRRQSRCPSFVINGDTTTSPSLIAEAFSQHFSSVWTRDLTPPSTASYPVQPARLVSPEMPTPQITPEDVLDAVSHINPFQNPGPDGIHPLIFKSAAPSMVHLLCSVQKILDSGVTPDAWRIAQVSPVHKGHSAQTDVLSSYWPIANTSIVCRTFELVLNGEIQTHLEGHGLLSAAQHGFRRNRSCETALGARVHTVSAHLDERTLCELVQLDLSRAFDRLPHAALLSCIEMKGISGGLLSWISSFISNCTQRVVYQGATSSSTASPRGCTTGKCTWANTVHNLH